MIIMTSSHRNTQLKQPANNQRTQIEIWTAFWWVLPAQPFYINRNKYRCIKLPVIGGQLGWRYEDIRYCLDWRTSPSMEYLIISLAGWLASETNNRCSISLVTVQFSQSDITSLLVCPLASSLPPPSSVRSDNIFTSHQSYLNWYQNQPI